MLECRFLGPHLSELRFKSSGVGLGLCTSITLPGLVSRSRAWFSEPLSKAEGSAPAACQDHLQSLQVGRIPSHPLPSWDSDATDQLQGRAQASVGQPLGALLCGLVDYRCLGGGSAPWSLTRPRPAQTPPCGRTGGPCRPPKAPPVRDEKPWKHKAVLCTDRATHPTCLRCWPRRGAGGRQPGRRAWEPSRRSCLT